jgi:hypothetical protein
MSDEKSHEARGAKGGKARADKLTKEQKAEIATKAALARWQNPRATKSNKTNMLIPTPGGNPRTPEQGVLDLQIEKQIEIDGIGMGVLSDGTPFLTGRGLARLCGIDSSRISELSSDWKREPKGPATLKVKEIINSRGVELEDAYIEIKQRSGFFYAYPDVLCLAVLEYWAFDAPAPREEAKRNFRILAGKALHDFIYAQVGYDPNNFVPVVWQQFHDRVSLTYNSVPQGYFSIFKEIADMIVTLGQAGLHIDSSFVPDGSVGGIWGNHWRENNFDEKFGPRLKWDHYYPDYFPQAKSNPQQPWCYPEAALPEFRRWMRENYIGGGKFANYINDKIRQKALPASFSQLVIKAYKLNEI